ncbi:Lipocalin-like domain-containing protein [Talaromyces proteolyticus]|uniref:Lipocalin-like domain-containing protein n=1 Tax=Talaromyces proteolyticus TaxID=1131652 RepID=A0AAD4KFN1_9EURO|nr:Lipocalin-like domain-containing protein [Talaromyces proteolyticus]KAH8691228.1 Lipocalin-like domain-containing protein [Talaromyces proteolyticus]
MSSTSEVQEKLVGGWSLVSATAESSNSTTMRSILSPSSTPLWGTNPKGILLYTADNYMSVQVVECERDSTFSTNDPRGGTRDELAECMKRFTAYSGSFNIRATDHGELLLEHHVEVCSFPNWTGSVQRRIMELDGNLLLLRTEGPILIEACVNSLSFSDMSVIR